MNKEVLKDGKGGFLEHFTLKRRWQKLKQEVDSQIRLVDDAVADSLSRRGAMRVSRSGMSKCH